MMDVVKAWADGQSFASICKMTSIYEGNHQTKFQSIFIEFY
jgi:superfamily II RNA helicase